MSCHSSVSRIWGLARISMSHFTIFCDNLKGEKVTVEEKPKRKHKKRKKKKTTKTKSVSKRDTSKNHKHSTAKNEDANRHNRIKLYDTYLDMHTLRQRPFSLESIERVATELLDWSRNDNTALVMQQFYDLKGIGVRTIHDWIKRSEKLKLAHETAKRTVGARREVGAITRKYDAGSALKMMPEYSSEWLMMEEKRAAMRNESKDKSDKNTVFKIFQLPVEKVD